MTTLYLLSTDTHRSHTAGTARALRDHRRSRRGCVALPQLADTARRFARRASRRRGRRTCRRPRPDQGHTALHINSPSGTAAGANRGCDAQHRSGIAQRRRSLDDLADRLTPEVSRALHTGGQPDPDLVIRILGEQRLSDFMLWQSAHSEFYFVEALDPTCAKWTSSAPCATTRVPPVPVRELTRMTTIDEFAAGFAEIPGYLDFARAGPLGRAVLEEEQALVERCVGRGSAACSSLDGQDERVRDAVSDLSQPVSGPDQVGVQPNTSAGLMHAMFGVTGGVARLPPMSPAPTFVAVLAAQSLGVLTPVWLQTDYGRVTPGALSVTSSPHPPWLLRSAWWAPHRVRRRPRRHPAGHRRPAPDRGRHPRLRGS